MRLSKLQDDDKKARKLCLEKLLESLKKIKEMLYYQGFPYVSKVIHFELINKHHKKPLVGHFEIKKDIKSDSQKILLVKAMKRC